MLPLIGITFQVSFSAALFPPHLPIVSTLLIATFNSLRPGSPRAAAAVRTWGPSTLRRFSLPQTKSQPNEGSHGRTRTDRSLYSPAPAPSSPHELPALGKEQCFPADQKSRAKSWLSPGSINQRIAGQGGGERSRRLSKRAVCLRLIKLWLSSSASEPGAAGTGAGREMGYSLLIQSRGRGDGTGGGGEEPSLSIRREGGFGSLPGRLCPPAAHGAPSCVS